MPQEPTSILEISFGWSSSTSFARAIELIQRLPSYQVQGEGQLQRHIVRITPPIESPEAWADLDELLDLISGWKSATIRLGSNTAAQWFGTIMTPIRQVRQCHRRRPPGALGEAYCSGKNTSGGESIYPGCRLVKAVSFATQPSYASLCPPWYHFGQLSIDEMEFSIDKTAIFETIKHASVDAAYILCPAFSLDRIKADIDALPDTINLLSSRLFELRYSQFDLSTPVGIQVTSRLITIPGLTIRLPEDPDSPD